MSVNSLSSLASKKIWFSRKEKLNDPFEGIVQFIEPINDRDTIDRYIEFGSRIINKHSELDLNQSKKFVAQRYIEGSEDFLSFISERLDKYKIDLDQEQKKLGIFSTAGDIYKDLPPQVSNMLLWTHYGDEFKGFCIKFDLEALKASLAELNPCIDFAWTKVKYVNKPHSVDILDNVERSSIDFLKSIQCKHEQWEYESEVRLISTEEGLMSFSEKAVLGVYIGERMPDDRKKLLIGTIKQNLPSIDIFNVCTDCDKYEVSVSKI